MLRFGRLIRGAVDRALNERGNEERAAMSERVSDERLKEIAKAYENLPPNLRDGDSYWLESIGMARELLALRASHKALYEALEVAKEFVENQQIPDLQWEHTLDTCMAALATAKQLQGAAEQKDQG